MGDLVGRYKEYAASEVFPTKSRLSCLVSCSTYCTSFAHLFQGVFNLRRTSVKSSNFPDVARVIYELRGQNVQGRRNKIKGVRLCRSRGIMDHGCYETGVRWCAHCPQQLLLSVWFKVKRSRMSLSSHVIKLQYKMRHTTISTTPTITTPTTTTTTTTLLLLLLLLLNCY